MGNKTVLFLLLGGILAACSPLDEPPSGGEHRRPGNGGAPTAPGTPEYPAPTPPVPKPDTVLYCTAVRFPDGYDWQRDSAYGSVPFDLILYRDGSPVLTLAWDEEACFGPDPDRHHLLGGHLYTECLSGAHTRVGRDGEELFRIGGREFLVGLLPDGADLYTLSRKTSGTGFSYRRNGTLLLESDNGIPFGDLSDPSYGPTGALCRDGGAVAFCYRDGTQLCRVRDGAAAPLEGSYIPGNVLDCKLHDGDGLLLQSSDFGLLMHRGRLWFHPDGCVAAGFFLSGRTRSFSAWMDIDRDTFPRQLCREEATIYFSPEATYAVAADAAGKVRWYGPDGTGGEELPVRFFSPKCATVSGGRLVLALTPLDASQPPYLLRGTQQTEFNLNGYISAVAVELSYPAS